ncbi:MAG: pyridoxamine 5'-phosphate oxidase family protein [Acidimicrobiales bacterium]
MAEHSVGFHEGELLVQSQAGVGAKAARLGGMLSAPDLRDGPGRFLADRNFAVLTARDLSGRLWISPVTGPPGFLEVADATTLRLHALPASGDPLGNLPPGQPAGLIAIDFAARRRARINGTLSVVSETGLELDVDQAFGNCPKYIRQRFLEHVPTSTQVHDESTLRTTSLEPHDTQLIRVADTFFLGTTHARRGSDVSHRGGPVGFVRTDGDALWWPDYPGNNLFNSLGNLAVDDTAALLFADFADGRTVHLSGSATLEWDAGDLAGDDGHTGRRVRFVPREIVAGHLLTVHVAR